MKIVVDARIISTTTGRYIERLLDYLQQIDSVNHYHVLLRAADFKQWQPKAPNFTPVMSDFPPYTFREQLQLWRQLRHLRPDLVHFTAPHFPLLYRGRRVVTVHDLTLLTFVNRQQTNPLRAWYKYSFKPWVFKRFTRLALRPATHIITPTKFVRDQVKAKFDIPLSQLSFTYEAADELAATPQPVSNLSDSRFILYVGGSRPYKNLQ